MFTFLLVLASLYNLANAGAADIDVCSVLVPVVAGGNQAAGAQFVRRPSVPVENCYDRDAPACFEIFKYDNNEMQIIADNRVP